MSKIDQVRAAMVEAMKAKDKERKDSLSMLLSALKNAQIDKREELTEAEENAVVKKEIKQTQETYDLAPADRQDAMQSRKSKGVTSCPASSCGRCSTSPGCRVPWVIVEMTGMSGLFQW